MSQSSPSDSGFSRAVRPALSQPLTTASSSATLVEHFRVGMSSTMTPVPRVTETSGSASVSAPNGDIASTLAHLIARLDAIEDTQARIGQELASVVARLEGPPTAPVVNGRSETGVEEEPRGTAQSGAVATKEPQGENSVALSVEALQKKVDELAETVRLDQARLYNRLRNATITNQKTAIQPLVLANGKYPTNVPGTQGEFEHMTKERYEHLLKSYGQPIKGDTIAKREAVREFLGLAQPNPRKT